MPSMVYFSHTLSFFLTLLSLTHSLIPLLFVTSASSSLSLLPYSFIPHFLYISYISFFVILSSFTFFFLSICQYDEVALNLPTSQLVFVSIYTPPHKIQANFNTPKISPNFYTLKIRANFYTHINTISFY